MRPSEWFDIDVNNTNGVLDLEVTYKTGTGSSKDHLPLLNPALAPALGCSGGELFKGSLNLWADHAVPLPSPAIVELAGLDWHFVPIVLEESRLGVVARRSDSGDIPFLEVFACDGLRVALGLAADDRVRIRLLPGRYLVLAA